MNSAKIVSAAPSSSGATMLTWLMTTAAWPRVAQQLGIKFKPDEEQEENDADLAQDAQDRDGRGGEQCRG